MAQRRRTGKPPEGEKQPVSDVAEVVAPESPPEAVELAPGEIRLRLTKDATLGNGQRKRGEVLGSCHVHPDSSEAEVFTAVADPRWTEQVPHDGGPGIVLRMARDRGTRKKGDDLCYVIPSGLDSDGNRADYTVRECINALRNPVLLGR